MRFALAVSLAFVSGVSASAQAQGHKTPSHSSPKLELRLFATKSTIRPGEQLKFRVELWNVGTEDVIIAQNLDSTFGNSALSLILQTGSGGEWHGDVGDRIPEPGEPDFEEAFLTNWLTLNKKHFYGTYVYMDPIDFPHLRKPGRYQISAQYYSRGISSTPGWNGAFLRQADIDKLPLAAFQGTINSNVVTIRALPRKNANKK
jgi:hypothetical protein